MNDNSDVRWLQRFSNFRKALKKLTDAIHFIEKDLKNLDDELDNESVEQVLDEIVREALIQRFEYAHELAWNVMKDFLTDRGVMNLYGSKDSSREAFKAGIIEDGDVWMEMIRSRNRTSHTYNEETARIIYLKITNEFYPAFLRFEKKMSEIGHGKQQDLYEKCSG